MWLPGGLGGLEVRTMWQVSRRGWWLMMMAMVTAAGCGAWAAPAATAGVRGPAARHPRVFLESVQMLSAKAGWALLATKNPTAGRGAPLLPARTADGGQSWVTVAPAGLAHVVGEPIVLRAASSSRAWVAVYMRVGRGKHATEVFATGNGGASWSRSAPAGDAEPVSVDFLDPAHGWLLESLSAGLNQNYVAVYRTVDAGRRWSLTAQTPPFPRSGTSRSGLPTYCDKSGMIFGAPRSGWITGYCDPSSPVPIEVLVTRDAGYHWALQHLPITPAACPPDGCFFFPPQFIGRTGFLTFEHYPATADLLVSHDGGHGWQIRHLPAGAGPYPQIRFFSTDRGIIVPGGAEGQIGSVFYLTSDGGQNWTPVLQGRRFHHLGTYVDFVSSTDGFAWISSADIPSGPAPDMYLTTDSGRAWTAITPRQA